jgi:hypothetical protein
MPIGGYWLELQGADELKLALKMTEHGMKDLGKAHRKIGKMAGEYVKGHEPLPSYDTRKDGKAHMPLGWMQSHTKGGGGWAGGYVEVNTEPAHYLMVQEFGGSSYWFRGAAGSLRDPHHSGVRQAVAGHIRVGRQMVRGHIIYKKARNPRGYFLWNVVWRLRDPIGRIYTEELEAIAERNSLPLEFMSSNLGLEPMPLPTTYRRT